MWRKLGRNYEGAERRGRRLSPRWLVLACALAGVIIFATLCPLHWRPHLSHDADQERFLAFMALGFAAKLAFPRHHIWTLTGAVVLAIGLEAAQLVIPGRDARVADACIKAIGAACGVQVGLFALMAKRAAFQRFGPPRSART